MRARTAARHRKLDPVLAALADPTRRTVIDLLRAGPRRAGELATALGMTPPAMSRHLRILRLEGLIAEQRSEEDARIRMFVLRPEAFVALRAWLDQIEAFWTDQLTSFKAHTEGRRGRSSRRHAPPPGR